MKQKNRSSCKDLTNMMFEFGTPYKLGISSFRCVFKIYLTVVI